MYIELIIEIFVPIIYAMYLKCAFNNISRSF